jgi:hypothetical protein
VHVLEDENRGLGETEAFEESPGSKEKEPSLVDGVVRRETEQECEIAGVSKVSASGMVSRTVRSSFSRASSAGSDARIPHASRTRNEKA